MSLAAILLTTSLPAVAKDKARFPPKVGKPHPPLALWNLTHDEPISITAFRGKKVLLIHFASW
ncbi:MAG: hypothetical protein B6D36_07880 [Planctomycetes bacterium UTPLA1]|nr:MAG: hypothetical protein B6D36_07880 [Planctomycetes bacterium UTPLA1]